MCIRDSDGTDYPEELKSVDAKVYSTYYTTRKDNAWAKANPDEVQQCYIMTGFYTSDGGELRIPLMQGISEELMQMCIRDRFYVIGGAGKFQIRDSYYKVSVGDMVILNPNIEHTETSMVDDPLEYIVLGIRGIKMSAELDPKQDFSIIHFNEAAEEIQR